MTQLALFSPATVADSPCANAQPPNDEPPEVAALVEALAIMAVREHDQETP